MQCGEEKLCDDKAHFELKVDAHAKCTNSDVIEALQENFYGALDNKKVDKTDPVRFLVIREENEKLVEVQDKYRVAVREDKLATEIVGLWNEPYEFDDLAVKNAVYGAIKVKITEVKVRYVILLSLQRSVALYHTTGSVCMHFMINETFTIIFIPIPF